jgi:hypothetical protein
VGTNLTHETVTDSQGSYRLPSLPPGQYKVQAELQGFKISVISGIVLQVAQQARVDLELQLGEVTETIDVVGTAPIIDTESPTIGSVVDQKKVVELPLNGRNFMEWPCFRRASTKLAAAQPRVAFCAKGSLLRRPECQRPRTTTSWMAPTTKRVFSTRSMSRPLSMPFRNSRFRSANTQLNLAPAAAQ